MCFGGSTQQPTIQQAPAVESAPVASPLPSPSPTKVDSQVTAEARRKKIAAVRYGMMSTIKTTSQGIVGKGAELTPENGKSEKLGG